jgi:hypothetical protein
LGSGVGRLGYGSDEAVAALGDGLDVDGRVGDVAQGVAEFHHGGVEAVVKVDERVGGPEDPTEVFAADELAGVLEEIGKHPEGLLADTDRNAVAPQFEIARVDFKDAETPDLRGILLDCQRRSPRPRCPWAESSTRVPLSGSEIF